MSESRPDNGVPGVSYLISYGKQQVPFQRVHATPLEGLTPIPESAFIGRSNTIFAAEVGVEVLGEDFLPAYTVGDNSQVVATDSMKNIIIRQAFLWDGATHESYLMALARTLTDRYEHVRDLRLQIRELPFPASVVGDGGAGFRSSDVLFDHRIEGDGTVATMRTRGQGDDLEILDLESGRVGLKLLKITGSSFTAFVHDEHTTLPDRRDRPLFIYLDIHWVYATPIDALGAIPARYVASEQIADIARTVFHAFVSESIQHLVHEMGKTILERFSQLLSVRFVAQNRTRDPWHQDESDPSVKVYSEPFPAFGEIQLKMTRDSAEG